MSLMWRKYGKIIASIVKLRTLRLLLMATGSILSLRMQRQNTKMPAQTNINLRTIALIIFLSMVPCVAIWAGMYVMKNVYWTFLFYHGLCVVPAIVWGRSLWRNSLSMPTIKQCLIMVLASILFAGSSLLLYKLYGDYLLNSQDTFALLKEQGYGKGLVLPMTFYFVFVNSTLEELFWRGVIFNKLDQFQLPFKHFAIAWSAFSYAAFHYLILRLVLFPGWAEFGVFFLFIYGAILALIYRRTGSLVTTSLTHAFLTDVTAMVLIVALLTRLHESLF